MQCILAQAQVEKVVEGMEGGGDGTLQRVVVETQRSEPLQRPELGWENAAQLVVVQ